MAYYNSGALSPGQSFVLGQYTISITTTPDPGEGTTGINVRCDKGAERERVSAEVEGTVESWSVEANDDTADVYVTYTPPARAALKPGSPSAVSGTEYCAYGSRRFVADDATHPILAGWISNPEWPIVPLLMDYQNDVRNTSYNAISTYIINGVTFYVNFGGGWPHDQYTVSGTFLGSFGNHDDVAEVLANQYFDIDGDSKEILVARFTIDLHDAGGTGPDSDWNDPGDYNEDADPGDPQKTLHLTVTGALSGRHNDPLHDTSYSYIPTPNDAVAGWGNGGNGGHGGGGGAGASTVIVRKFATDKAGHKDIIALAKRHGYGSGGGKGAKGGDGCILIFY